MLNKLNKRIMANPVNASETGGWHGRLADWSSQSLAVLLWNFPTVFFCVKKCNRCFLLHDFMSWTICKIKQHDIRIEFQFFSQQTKSYKIQISIHLPWWDQFYLLRFASLIGSGTCWSQQKKTAKWCNWRVSPQPAPHGSLWELKISPTKSFLKMFFLFSM